MLSPKEVVDQYYLEVRCKILEIAAILDRYDRAVRNKPDGAIPNDRRMQRCKTSLELLTREIASADRAEQVALIFSDPVPKK